METLRLTIQDLLEGYQRKEWTPTQVATAYLKEVEGKNSDLAAFLEEQPEGVLKRARDLEAKPDAAKLPLYGVPVAIKDNILVKNWKATAGSKILKNYVSPYTASCVERLEAAGAIVIGKTNCDEFAMGSSNENSAFGPVKNPWDLERVPGGSSGGSAAAVAGGLAPSALGTDTGGSIRQPAALCGIVGLKPSYGRVSRYGVIAYGSSLDQVGPFGRTVWDTARTLEVIAGYDPKDATSSRGVVPKYTEALSSNAWMGARNKTIGIARDWLKGVDAGVAKAFDGAVQLLKAQGMKVVDVALPHAKFSLSTYYLLATSEASSNLSRYDGVHYGHRTSGAEDIDALISMSRGEGFGKEVKLRIMLGTYALSAGYYDAYYLKAAQVRKLIQKDFEEAFQNCHAILSPTSPTTAFRLGEKTADPLTMYLSDVFTLPVNLAGLPGLSLPCGLDEGGLPIGLQFIGKSFDEAGLFELAYVYEQVRGTFALPQFKNRKGK